MRSRILWAIIALALVIASIDPLRAADKEGDHGHKVDHKKIDDAVKAVDDFKAGKLKHEDLQKELEKFHAVTHAVEQKDTKVDLFKGWLDLSIYTIIVFLILFFVLRAFAWGPIVEGLNRREQAIAQAHKDAENARQEAARTQAALEGQRKQADEEIRQRMDKARADAEAVASEREAQGKAALAAERERQRRELQIERDQALQEIWNQGAQLATLISGRAIKKNLSYEDHRALLDEALADFRAAASSRKHDIESATA